MTTDSETTEQYLNFVWTRFLIPALVFVSRDYELGTKFHVSSFTYCSADQWLQALNNQIFKDFLVGLNE